MDAGTLSIQKIFGYDRRLVVPLFQRPYVWTRDQQWEPLWEDVRSVADRLVDGGQARPHFLGAIVLDMVPKQTGHLETRLVIDGQQRLTTIQLLLESFSDICAERGIDRYDRALAKLTRNDDPMSDDPDEQFKVWPTNVDQDHFRRVMRAESPAEMLKEYGRSPGAKTAGQPIADAYLYFHREVEAWLGDDDDGFSGRVEALYAALREHVRLVVIDLEKEDDAQLIFETLNARGTPLLPSDLIKNFLFHRAQIQGKAIQPLYERHWRPFDDDGEYWRKEIGRGHAKRARIDSFLQHLLTLKTEDETPVAQLYNGYRDHVQADGTGGAEDHLGDIRRYAEVFRGFETLPAHTVERRFVERLDAMEYSTVYPFLMELFARFGERRDELRAVLGDVESFLIRRMVCQLDTRGYGRLFIDLLPALRSAGGPGTAVRELLLGYSAEGRRWPDDREFFEAWVETPIYRVLVQRRTRMLLEALEMALRSDKSEKVTIDEKLTIEHLMPQQWEASWPAPPGEDQETVLARRSTLLNTIGNLTLVTRKLNPSMSNGPWEKKRQAVGEHSVLVLNRAFDKIETWDEDAIVDRSSSLFDVARRLWPYPGA